MNLTTRDRIATLLVAMAVLIYGGWLAGMAGGMSAGAIAIVVLALGFLASASAVVPGFAALLRGSRAYLAMASLVGLVALGSGILSVVNATEATLAVLVIATLLLWATATLRHMTARPRRQVTIA